MITVNNRVYGYRYQVKHLKKINRLTGAIPTHIYIYVVGRLPFTPLTKHCTPYITQHTSQHHTPQHHTPHDERYALSLLHKT